MRRGEGIDTRGHTSGSFSRNLGISGSSLGQEMVKRPHLGVRSMGPRMLGIWSLLLRASHIHFEVCVPGRGGPSSVIKSVY